MESKARAELRAGLQARRPALERAVLIRVRAISDPAEVRDPAYLEGLRTAVASAVEHGLAVLAAPGGPAPPVPPALLAQARLAARGGVGLDTVLRRYLAGHSILSDALVGEAGGVGLEPDELKRLLRELSTSLERLLAAVGAEHERETREKRPLTAEQRRTERVRRLLAGEMVDASGLGYELDAHHIALAGGGPGAEEAIRTLGASLDRRLLFVTPDENVAWAWFGGRLAFELGKVDEIASALARDAPEGVFALGEPGSGAEGWRLSHRQALAALPIALRGEKNAVRYSDVALLASVARDDLLVASLRRLVLDPLEDGRDGRELRRTLRAYFQAARNVSATAAALGVKRHTVTKRLRAVEQATGRLLDRFAAETEIALRIDELEGFERGPTRGQVGQSPTPVG